MLLLSGPADGPTTSMTLLLLLRPLDTLIAAVKEMRAAPRPNPR
ncbi:MAG TPA: hypothetical protein VHX88_19180 [Solirubrobacteraceae bacterium]|nr:hypothetical protein [Solirubrobacteraceae bacterium]